MNRIKIFIPLLFSALTLLWLSAESITTIPWAYFSIRKVVVQYSGILAIAAMSIAMLLALRLRPIEKLTQGIDKSYRLHKWLGISCLVLGIIHWFWAKGTKYMVGMGLLERPARHGKGPIDLTTLEGFFRSQRHFAEGLGEWGFYLLIVLIVIALTKIVRYPKFLNTHKIMALIYLLFVYHTIILTKLNYWQQPIGWLLAGLIAAGSWAAIYSLRGKIGQKNKVKANIEQFHFFADNRVLDITLNTHQQWPGHDAGQFAFLQFNGEEPHPFTIASAQNDNGRIRFQIKAIGDFTNQLKDQLKINDPVVVEGPYGCFNFKSASERQIWVAGGIGIAAFTAQMEKRAQTPNLMPVDLYYCTQCPDRDFIKHITQLASQAKINLHVINTTTAGFLTAKQITEDVTSWKKADVWFCGPNTFSTQLQHDFALLGLPTDKFHQELFAMR
jgi:predicted ferric reductase